MKSILFAFIAAFAFAPVVHADTVTDQVKSIFAAPPPHPGGPGGGNNGPGGPGNPNPHPNPGPGPGNPHPNPGPNPGPGNPHPNPGPGPGNPHPNPGPGPGNPHPGPGPGNPSSRTDIIRCESQNNRANSCVIPYRNILDVRLQRQISSNPCINNVTYKIGGNSIWVNLGCRADFAVTHR